MTRPASIFSALTVFLCTVASALDVSETRDLHADIIMHKNDDGIAACGMGFQLTSAKGRYAVNLVNEKSASNTVTKLIATSHQQEVISSATVRTLDFSTHNILKKVQSAEHTTVYAEKLPPDTLGSLFQQLMVSGAKIEIATMSETMIWNFPGPASQSLRSMYLMCSGDMYRP